MSARRILTVLAGSLGVLFVGSCGGTSARPVEVITVFGAYRGVEADRFAASVESFTARTGVEVRYTGSADFVADLIERVETDGMPPDVALVPQPGVVRRLVDRGSIVPLAAGTVDAVESNYSPEAADLGVFDGQAYAVPFRVSVKSLVWFRPDVFLANGWTVPETLDELERLAETMAASGGPAPWCLALRSGSATGWPATDWVEDLLVRRSGLSAATAWVDGSLGFTSAEVRAAFDDFESLVLTPGRVAGGRAATVEQPVVSVFDGLLADPPRCAMVKQSDAATAWLPPGTSIGPAGDVDRFVLPGVGDPADGPPLLVGGELAVGFRRSETIDSFLAHLAGPDGGTTWAGIGGFISPRSTFDVEAYPDESSRVVAELVVGSEVLVFDLSDQMPAEIGTSAFWAAMTSWTAGATSFEELATDLDARRAEG